MGCHNLSLHIQCCQFGQIRFLHIYLVALNFHHLKKKETFRQLILVQKCLFGNTDGQYLGTENTYRWAKIMSHFVRHGHMRNCRRNMLAIVEQSDDSGVKTLESSTIMLQQRKGIKYYFLCLFEIKKRPSTAQHVSTFIFTKNLTQFLFPGRE